VVLVGLVSIVCCLQSSQTSKHLVTCSDRRIIFLVLVSPLTRYLSQHAQITGLQYFQMQYYGSRRCFTKALHDRQPTLRFNDLVVFVDTSFFDVFRAQL
jgi:hypothetical protein